MKIKIKTKNNILFFLFFLFFFKTFYISEYNSIGLKKTFFTSKKAGINIVLNEIDSLKIKNYNENLYEINKNLLYLEPKISSKYKKISFEIISNKKQSLKLQLISPWILKNYYIDGGYPIFINYKNLIIDNKKIKLSDSLKEDINVSYNSPFIYELDIKKDEPINISFEVAKYKPHNIFEIFSLFNINYKIFIITIIISCILSYYLSNLYYNTITKYSYIKEDIIYLIFFSIILFIPMSNISKEKTSINENRALAEYKPLFNDKIGLNLNYGNDFDKWFNDRFNGRKNYLNFFDKLNYFNNVIIKGEKAHIKKTNWFIDLNRTNYIFNKNNEKITDNIINNVKEINDFAKKNNIKFYFLIMPNKERIYKNEFDFLYNEEEEKIYFNFIKKLKSNFKENQIIFPYEELIKAKKNDFVFPKNSHHWTDYGAYICYKSLIENIQKDFKDIYLSPLTDYKKTYSTLLRDDWNMQYNIGTHIRYFNYDKDFAIKYLLKDKYIHFDNVKNPKLSQWIQNKKYSYIKDFPINKNGKYKILLLGSSISENFLLFLPYSAKETKYIRLIAPLRGDPMHFNILKYDKKIILDFKPDIIILLGGEMNTLQYFDFNNKE